VTRDPPSSDFGAASASKRDKIANSESQIAEREPGALGN